MLLLFGSRNTAYGAEYGHSAVVARDGYPVFTVDGRPFFVYGAAFFYERLPRDMWNDALLRLRSLGINTLDLYVPWNWHELQDNDFDFSGRTSPRRDLHELMRLARAFDFKIILRPGPVIRNEWRNGGYPAWLLARPEYGMPLHDLLEGRYPPTATLQNANADDAAAQWMANATHMRYAKRWLERVLHEFQGVADLVIAVQLDDDQGAYIDNQTWPAPHLQAYLRQLTQFVHGVTGATEPVFINTYEMKVTASSPVWAMGNWYQSDTYTMGEHDRAQLELATGLLQTQSRLPLMISEFQAGWLQQPGDIAPRPADPTNTELALGTLLGMGARGLVNFPAQDTLNPAGMEAPFANAFYAWDAALRLDGGESQRFAPTRRIGEIVHTYGERLASSHLVADAAIAYLTSSFDASRIDNHVIAQIAAAASEAQKTCRALSLTCALVDLRLASDQTLARYPLLIVPMPPAAAPSTRALSTQAQRRVDHYTHTGATVITLLARSAQSSAATVEQALHAAHHERIVSFAPGASFAKDTSGKGIGFLILPNYGNRTLRYASLAIRPDDKNAILLHNIVVAPRRVLVAPISLDGRIETVGVPDLATNVLAAPRFAQMQSTLLPITRDQFLPDVSLPEVKPGFAQAFAADVYREGSASIVLQNSLIRVVIAPNAGARAFVFEDLARRTSVFTSVGALRDDVKIEPPLSTTDRIAQYTHQFPAGMFNRHYDTAILATGKLAMVRFSYDAPDVLPHGAHFERILTLAPDQRTLGVEETVRFIKPADQRAVSVTSLAVGSSQDTASKLIFTPQPQPFTPNATLSVSRCNLGFYDQATHELATVTVEPDDIEVATITAHNGSLTVRLTLAPEKILRTTYGYYVAPNAAAAQRIVAGSLPRRKGSL